MTDRSNIHLIRAASRILFTASIAVVLLRHAPEMNALQKMAGYTAHTSLFSNVQDYLDKLRDSLIPLAIPLGAIGLVGGGAAYMVGNVMAQKILGGVLIGVAIALMGPSIIA
jgi:hypothetical protein